MKILPHMTQETDSTGRFPRNIVKEAKHGIAGFAVGTMLMKHA
jgi:hypothetical protein